MCNSKPKGFSLVEILVVMAIMSIMALGSANFFVWQMKSNNFSDLQSKRTQLRLALLGQFLSSSSHCKCAFPGLDEFPASTSAPGITLQSGGLPYSANILQRYSAGCTPDTGGQFISSTGIDSLKSNSIRLEEVHLSGGNYIGKLSIEMESLKEVAGPKQLLLRIPVVLQTVPGSPGNVQFDGCSSDSSTTIVPLVGLCGSNEYLAGYDAMGAKVCKPLGACPAGQISKGYDTITGNIICSAPITSCPVGQMVTGFDTTTGTVTCSAITYQ